MTLLHRLVSILRWAFHRNRSEQDLNDELQAFVDMAALDKQHDGTPPSEAHRLALLELGGVEQTKERIRHGRHGAWIDEVGRDIRYAFRMAGRSPGFTLVVVITLALGIGVNTAMFGLLDALMLRRLPVRDPERLVLVEMQSADASSAAPHLSYSIARALAERDDIFARAAGFSGWRFNVGPAGSVAHVPGALVTGAYYEALGLNPTAGRLLTPADDERGAPLVAVISHGYWERQFANRADAIGQTLIIGGASVTIVGVSPRGFVGANVGESADITMPVAALPLIYPEAAQLLERGNFWLRVLARPVEGVSIEQATGRLNAVWPRLSEPLIAPHWPPTRRKAMTEATFQLSPGGTGWTNLRDQYTKPLLVLMGAVGVVLLIACANVASLALARASARQREMAVRVAIGASRGRVVRQLLIESTLLSLTGATVGLVLAWLTGRYLIQLLSTGPVDIVFDLSPNGHVLAFTLVTAIATSIAFGTAPAIHAAAAAPSTALKSNARTTASSSRLLPWLVSGQVALSLVLLVAASLFVRTLQNLHALNPGFTAEGVLLVDFDARRTALSSGLLANIRQLPGVVSASVTTHTPLSGAIWSEPAVPAGQPIPERDTALFVGAGPGFLDLMRIGLLAGREFTERDTADRPPVAIVNEAFVRRSFPNQNPVGQHLSAIVRGSRRDLEIVGLAADTRVAGLRAAPPATVYVAYAQLSGNLPSTVVIRAVGPLGQISEAIRDSVQKQVPNALIEVRALSAQVEARLVQERMLATLASGFGLLALVMASIGLYGLLAYGVARRIKEIGIRMALGAHRRSVTALVAKSATRLVVIGLALGAPVAIAASRWFESMLFGLDPTDLTTIAGAIAVLVLTAYLAAYVPARRASRVDPLAALRHE